MLKPSLTFATLLSIGLALHAQTAPDSSQTAQGFTIENCVSEFSMDEAHISENGYQFWFLDRDFLDGRTIKMSVVGPKAAKHAPHTHDQDEIFFVLEGTAEFYLDGERKVVGPYSSFYCPPGVEHGIRNVGDTELKYLVIRKYDD